jgi:hypothetical protein
MELSNKLKECHQSEKTLNEEVVKASKKIPSKYYEADEEV